MLPSARSSRSGALAPETWEAFLSAAAEASGSTRLPGGRRGVPHQGAPCIHWRAAYREATNAQLTAEGVSRDPARDQPVSISDSTSSPSCGPLMGKKGRDCQRRACEREAGPRPRWLPLGRAPGRRSAALPAVAGLLSGRCIHLEAAGHGSRQSLRPDLLRTVKLDGVERGPSRES
jgi:hypothetical protein